MNSFDVLSVNPYIRTAIYSVIKAGRKIERRIILDYELLYIKKGSFTLEYGENEYDCKAGDFILIHPGVSHAFKNITDDLYQPHIHFDLTYDGHSLERYISFVDYDSVNEKYLVHNDYLKNGNLCPILNFNDKKSFLEIFYRIINSQEKNSLACKSYMLSLIDVILKDNDFIKSIKTLNTNYSIEKQIKDYIDSGQGIAISLSELEKQYSYSKYHIEKKFRKTYGMSVIAYRNKKRMELAVSLLEKQNISAVSEILGFSSIYSFSRTFKDYYGICPSSFLNQKKLEKK